MITRTLNLPLLTLLALCISLLLTPTTARHLRRGPSASRREVTLHGSAVVDSYWDQSRSARKTVGWSAKLLKDIITWYDLQKDQIRIMSCSSAHVQLAGNRLDLSDYKPGAVFVIDMEDWERNCATPKVQRDIPEEDDALFYQIKGVAKLQNSVFLSIKRISGEEVVPEVNFDVAEDQGTANPGGVEGEVQIFGDDEIASLTRQQISLPTSSRVSLSLDKSLAISPEVSLAFNAGVSASISGFKLVRLRGLKFRWIQRLAAEAGTSLSVTKAVEATKAGRLLQVPVPNFGFRTRRIPFVGRASAGAFVRVDWVLELNAQTTVTAEFDIRREIRRRVDAKVFPPTFTTTELAPLEPNTQSSTLEFGREAEASINGFGGVRPSLGLEFSLGKKQAGGNIGLKIGLELDTTIRTPPFEAVSGGGLKIGVCDACHALQGTLDVVIKDLTLQLERKRKVTREIMILADIFEFNIGTVCAIPKPCFVSTAAPPSTIQLPTPSPTATPPIDPVAPVGSCKSCRNNRECPTRHRCRGVTSTRRGQCHLQLQPDQICGGRCTDCPN